VRDGWAAGQGNSRTEMRTGGLGGFRVVGRLTSVGNRFPSAGAPLYGTTEQLCTGMGPGVAAFAHCQQMMLGLESGLSFGIANRQRSVAG
jgi:hypothetical protein